MKEYLIRWLEADNKISELEAEKKNIEASIKSQKREAESARLAITAYMRENGLVKDIIEGEYCNYTLTFPKLRGSLKCNPEAVPDEFCDIIRKPKLKEIREYITNNPVNWASIEFGEEELIYSISKKG